MILCDDCKIKGKCGNAGYCLRDEGSASSSNDLLVCMCGAKPETWLQGGWVFTGCKACGLASAAFKDFKLSERYWQRMAATN